MTQSVRSPASDLVTVEILAGGRAISDSLMVREVSVDRLLNRLPEARIVIEDGDPSQETFKASESSDFAPGKEIEVKLGYHAKNVSVFKGIILRQALEVDEIGASALTLVCGDKAAALTVARGAKVFIDSTDSAAMSALISAAGLSADVSSTSGSHPHLAQANATAWDFILARAEINGMVVDVAGGKVRVAKPDFSSAEYDVLFGESLIAISLELDAPSQLGGVKALSWSAKEQETVEASGSDPSVNSQGNISGTKLAEVLGVKDFGLQTPDPVEDAALKTWADAQLLKSRLARFRGWISFPGNAAIVPGKALKLQGLGARFDGEAYVAGVRHRASGGTWVTEARFGLDRKWFTDTHRDATMAPASARLPGATGLQIAKVVQVNGDPESAGRIKVSFPLLPGSEGLWVRVAQPYASEEIGITFLPEVGDELVVGFLGGDPNAPVMLGALHSAKRKPAFTPEETNAEKSIVTRSRLSISFDDEKKVLTVKTPGGHSITLSDEEKSIEVADSNGNTLKMAESGMSLSTPADMTISATGSVSISGDAGVSIDTPADVSVSGGVVSISAETEFSADGAASASVTSAGELSITGSLVMIN
ncbi:type VI secretion system tip protein VgrG [Vannielia litorea]|uniref:type VI secretion system tip protein VgrG n=1 Tax=Vannielia litorea TaxID=1217970 RepID=UPI001BCCBFE7|nr:type VI secretion system tip protein VgrG [Vannielia litorea]MBS8226344.1 type VI secretion system tip protein VgrG [Vannielia litorea]